MAKRSADEQITKDGDGIFDVKDEKSQENFASADVMASRKILKPKGRNFQFLRKADAGASSNLTPDGLSEDKAEKLKALANKFLTSIQQANLNQVIPDYRPIAQKYLLYYEEILASQDSKISKSTVEALSTGNLDKSIAEDKVENPFATLAQKAIKTPEVPSGNNAKEELELDSEDEKKSEVKIQGPKFSMSSIPTTKRSAFSFGTNKPAKKNDRDSDSDSEIEIKGPSFTFTKEIKDPIFKLQQSLNISQSQATPIISGGNQELNKDINLSSKIPITVSSGSNKSNESESKNEGSQTAIPSSSQDNEKPSQIVKPVSIGEEEETVLFQVKAKLMILKKENVNNPYQSIGVGELKVLKSEERGSLRVLIRAEGGLRLLLNALLIKDVEYSTLGNGSFVRFPALDDNQQIVTYVIKVGSAENGEKLCGIFNSAKVN